VDVRAGLASADSDWRTATSAFTLEFLPASGPETPDAARALAMNMRQLLRRGVKKTGGCHLAQVVSFGYKKNVPGSAPASPFVACCSGVSCNMPEPNVISCLLGPGIRRPSRAKIDRAADCRSVEAPKEFF
jgi:hypothetical protein